VAYVYGFPQLLARDLYVARLTSVVITGAMIALLLATVRRLAGAAAGAATAVLVTAFVFGTYHLVIVKTYPLVSLFMTAAFAALVLLPRPEVRLPLATASAILATAARTAAFPLAVIVAVYALVAAVD